MQKVDQATVKALESKAPRFSRLDAQAVQGQLMSGRIFSAFSQQDREAIWCRLCSIDGLTPSLFTFFEDIKYLQATADCVKQLIKLSPRDSVFTALDNCFSNASQTSDQCIIQEADSTFAVKPGTAGDYFDLYYRQIWLGAMRKYPKVPVKRKKKKKGLLAKVGGREPACSKINSIWRLATVLDVIPEVEAHNLGQCTPGSAPRRDGATRIDPTQRCLPVKVTDPEGPSLLEMRRILSLQEGWDSEQATRCLNYFPQTLLHQLASPEHQLFPE
jgi:hypothetical protein